MNRILMVIMMLIAGLFGIKETQITAIETTDVYSDAGAGVRDEQIVDALIKQLPPNIEIKEGMALGNLNEASSSIAETQPETSSSVAIEPIGSFRITGYCPSEYVNDQTASGTKPVAGRTIALNNTQRKELGLSYGQEVYIEGPTINGLYIIEDCGCGRDVIDIYCDTIKECYAITTMSHDTTLYIVTRG